MVASFVLTSIWTWVDLRVLTLTWVFGFVLLRWRISLAFVSVFSAFGLVCYLFVFWGCLFGVATVLVCGWRDLCCELLISGISYGIA